ncbi:MAG TPA: hypothetical protein VGK50_04490 [Coriobacteriia bacterium]|jgi:hypothetical protein
MTPKARISLRTMVIGGTGLALAAGVYVAVRLLLNSGAEELATAVSDVGGTAVIGACALVILYTAFGFRKGDAVGLHWKLIGAGVLVYTLGEATWSYIEVVQKSDAFPSAADIFYVLTYVLLGAGIIMAALGYRRLIDLRAPFAIAAVVSVALIGGMYALLLRGTLADAELGGLAKVLSVGYPIADVVLEFAPALLIVLVAWRLGRGSFGWPWWPLALGVAIIAVSDSGFALLDAKGLYQAGDPVDAGWMLGNVLIATGALVARDVFGLQKASAEEALDAA